MFIVISYIISSQDIIYPKRDTRACRLDRRIGGTQPPTVPAENADRSADFRTNSTVALNRPVQLLISKVLLHCRPIERNNGRHFGRLIARLQRRVHRKPPRHWPVKPSNEIAESTGRKTEKKNVRSTEDKTKYGVRKRRKNV